MSKQEVEALRAKRLGDAALEVLLSLYEERILIFVNGMEAKEYITEFEDRYRPDSLGVFAPGTCLADSTTLSTSSSRNLFESLGALMRREWITRTEASEWLAKLEKKEREAGKKIKSANVSNRTSITIFTGYIWEKRYVFSITDEGKQALRDMPARIAQFWQAKNSGLEFIVTSQTMDKVGSKVAAGIYAVDRRAADRVWIKAQTIEGAHEFPKDRTVHNACVHGRVFGRYVKNEDILAMNACIEDFNRLYKITLHYQDKKKELTAIATAKVLQIEKEFERAQKALERAVVKATKNLVDQCKPVEVDENSELVLSEEDLGFKI